MVNLQLKTAIEGAVIKWAHQINDVLMETSEVFFKDNNNPVPRTEVINLLFLLLYEVICSNLQTSNLLKPLKNDF